MSIVFALMQTILSTNLLLSKLSTYLQQNGLSGQTKYIGVIDAGTTGTRFNVYGFMLPDKILSFYHASYTQPGLQGLSSSKEIENYLKDLIDRSQAKLEAFGINIKSLDVIFDATAGLRKITTAKSDIIINIVKNYLEKKGFNTLEVKVISGFSEGLYALESLDFLIDLNNNIIRKYGCKNDEIRRMLNAKVEHFCEHVTNEQANRYIGIVDMGGGSTQLAYEFDLNEKYTDPIHVIVTPTKKIYINSYNGWGLKEAMKVLEENKDYKLKNRKETKTLYSEFIKDLEREHKPDINHVDDLFLSSYFYDKFSKLGFKFHVTLRELFNKLKDKCNDRESKYCNEVKFMTGFLKGLGIDEEKNLMIVKDIAGINLSWTLSRAVMAF